MGEQLLLRPLYSWLATKFGGAYCDATGHGLTDGEVRDLVRFLSARESDAVHFLLALHRYAWQAKGPDNAASRLQRVRALADLLLVFESSLRRWQSLASASPSTLFPRIRELLKDSAAGHAELNARLSAYPKANWEDTKVLNRMVKQELARFGSASLKGEKTAVAVFTSYRLRNSLMHVLDDQLVLVRKPEVLEQVLAFALVAIRASRFGAEKSISAL